MCIRDRLRLFPKGSNRRFRRHAGRRHEDHDEAAAEAAGDDLLVDSVYDAEGRADAGAENHAAAGGGDDD